MFPCAGDLMLCVEIDIRDEHGDWCFGYTVQRIQTPKDWGRIVDDDDWEIYLNNFIYVGF